MRLQTIIPLEKSNNQLDYESKVLLIGSCFSENIGNKLSYFKFQSIQNPFGILFNPVAIENHISKSISEYQYTERDIFFLNERWHCFDAHSSLSNSSKEAFIFDLNSALEITRNRIKEVSHFIITFGTSWVYNHIEGNKIVANCHKVPQKAFEKKLLSVEEIEKSLTNIIQLVKTINPKCELVFTVSPVRHLKDGFVENQQSKSHLIAAIHSNLSPRVQSGGFNYFPSYEIMMDELRDYRFYGEDMIHPNQLAIDYIWERFQEVWVSSSISETMEKVDKIQKGLAHRSFNPSSEASILFKAKLQVDIDNLTRKHPYMEF